MKNLFCTLHVRRSPQAVPLAAGCLAVACAGQLRKESRLLDFFPEDADQDIIETICAEQPTTVLFPVYVWNRLRVVRVIHLLHKRNPSLQFIGGGPEATGDPQGLLEEAPWTALVLGEGEEALVNLLKMLAGGGELHPVPGVVFPGSAAGSQKASGPDLNKASSPWLDGILQPTPEGGVLWEVARGCAFSCDYCFDARGHAGVRQVPTDRLEAELNHFVDQGVSQVWVLDSTFNYPPERGVALLEMLIKNAPQLHYHLEAKADFLDHRTIRLLGNLNCSVQIGLQSVHEKVLQKLHRPVDLDILAEKVHLMEAEGIVYGFDLIYGLPGDNYAGFRQSVDAVLSFAPNHIHIFPLSVLPGTRLAEQKDRYGIRAEAAPPYQLLYSDDWTEEEMELCRRLTTAVDLFYNTGRAVAFFPTILDALQTTPSQLFEDFFRWLLQQPDIEYETLMDAGNWSAQDVYRMLQGYLCHQLRITGQGHLVSVFLDLLCYHYHYAETLLGEELPPPRQDNLPDGNVWETPWQRSSQFRLVPFAYEILDLLEMEEMQMDEIANLFRPVGSVALFMRRDNEVFCESLGEEMLMLLKKSDGQNSPKEIFSGSVSQRTGEELVRFALSEGLLLPAHASVT